MGAFACLVVAKQESAQAVPQILTALGVVGLMASICVNYAPALDSEERETVVRCGEQFLLACICLVLGLFVKYGSEMVGQAAYVKVKGVVQMGSEIWTLVREVLIFVGRNIGRGRGKGFNAAFVQEITLGCSNTASVRSHNALANGYCNRVSCSRLRETGHSGLLGIGSLNLIVTRVRSL
jgi:hypothetical protein